MKAFGGTPVATVYNDQGVPFTVRLVRRYGLNHMLVHNKQQPMVEFYDGRYVIEGREGDELGQFVSRYNVDDLLSDDFPTGLYLDFGIPECSLDHHAMKTVRSVVSNWMNRG